MQLRERLIGLGLMLFGSLNLMALKWVWQMGWLQPPHPPLPPGLRADMVPIISPVSCLYPFIALGAIGLILVGLKRFLAP